MLKRKLQLISLSLVLSFSSVLFSSSVHAKAVNDNSTVSATTSSNIDFSTHFINVLLRDETEEGKASMKIITDNWHAGLIPIALETVSFGWTNPNRPALIELISKDTPSEINNVSAWYNWLWNNENFSADKSYHDYKAKIYKRLDPKFETYFKDREELTRIRLDEVQWGGVRQDGIPPLRNPDMISANEASYLGDDNIVFGIEINGDVRAYPKRILAWHEMFTDTIGGVDIAGVYCTLCGTVIPFKTNHKGKKYKLGTSGFLYRSNKLMYDKDTQTLWSTTRGKPVIGPLVDQDIELEYESVVTTTWGEWKKRHPDTTVLSLDTGHQRDYGEGVAYDNYFGTDSLMFRTPFNDTRLKNKQEILALRFPAAPNQQLAIDTDFLKQNPLYENRIGAQKFIVLTDKSGANRVYDPKGVQLTNYDGSETATDSSGEKWAVNESNLVAANGTKLPRLPYHRAFWFGWRAAFPETTLIK